jgi:hypothetical protein
LDFVGRMRNFAPFNAMLLQIQKPGLRHAATKRDWLQRFNRAPKSKARPLLILWPFGPVALVYDVVDTEGDLLPEDVATFPVLGSFPAERLEKFKTLAVSANIKCTMFDAGDARAGEICVTHRAPPKSVRSNEYLISTNQNHSSAEQLCTLAHELGHLFLGHIGGDKNLGIKARCGLTHAEQEIEAESVAFLICSRLNVKPKSQTYLSNFIKQQGEVTTDVYQIMRAAGRVEQLLQLNKAYSSIKPINEVAN